MSESTLQDTIRNIIAYHCDERKHDFRLGKACVQPLIDDIVAAVATLYRREKNPEDFTIGELSRLGRNLGIPIEELRQCIKY